MSLEPICEYGSRAGVSRLLDCFCRMEFPLTVFGATTILKRNPDQAGTPVKDGHEISAHGCRWIDYTNVAR